MYIKMHQKIAYFTTQELTKVSAMSCR